MLLDKLQTTISGSKSIVGFETEGSGDWDVWDRYLTIDGKKAFHIGNICGTCSFFFERLEGANQSINTEDIVEALYSGLARLDASVVNALERIVPDGKYEIVLQRIRPRLIQLRDNGDYFTEEQLSLWSVDGFWGMPHFPKTEYYRLQTRAMNKRRGLFEFLIPIFPHSWLRAERVAEYQELLSQGVMPTAVTISVLDVKSPANPNWADRSNITSHWCLGHYLIDGHHQVYAAAVSGTPLTLVSFLAVDQSISSEEEIDEMLALLNEV